MKVKKHIGETIEGFTILGTRKAFTKGGKVTSRIRLRCENCGREFESIRDDAKTCSDLCRRQLTRIDRNRRYNTLKKIGHFDYSVTLRNVFDKYNGICQSCGKQLNFDCDCLSDDYPSIDHIKPLSKGGFHEWNNVQLLCRHCNFLKGTKTE